MLVGALSVIISTVTYNLRFVVGLTYYPVGNEYHIVLLFVDPRMSHVGIG